jgi:hypothetical protein
VPWSNPIAHNTRHDPAASHKRHANVSLTTMLEKRTNSIYKVNLFLPEPSLIF